LRFFNLYFITIYLSKIMKSFKISLFLFMLLSIAFASCKKEETLTAENLTVTITAVADAQTVGTVSATASSGEAITYAITSQNVATALSINSTTGVITIPSERTIWDAYCSATPVTTLTATVTATSGELTTTSTVTITLNIGAC
jgi:hypothetical protein